MLVAKEIVKDFPEGEGKRLLVLDGIDIEVSSGEFLAITGESGVGKSTLLHILGLLDTPTSGEITLDGNPLSGLSDGPRAAIRSSTIGFVFQFHHLLPEFDAIENVSIPLRLAGISESEATKQAVELLESVGLSERMKHFPNTLSGGEQQRVALARAMANEPRLLLADEPTGNLDEKNADRLIEMLFEQTKNREMAVILATHNRELAAMADRILLLEKGIVVDITTD